MPTRVPNFNFLAQLVSEIWGGSQNKKVGAANFPRRPLADKFLYQRLVRVNAYKCAKFQLPGSNSFRDKKGVLKFNVGATSPPTVPRTLKILCVLKVLGKFKQRAKFQHRISMDHAVMPICILHRLSIICAQKWFFFGGVWGWRCENIVFWPQKGTTLREHASVDVSHVKIGSMAWTVGR